MEDILIVDDSDSVRNQLKWGLDSEYRMHFASDGAEALSFFNNQPTKVVILDLGLPPDEEGTEEGFRCLRSIVDSSPAAKVIIVTGQNERENALKAIQMGAYDFLQKPIDLSELKIIINRAFYLHTIEEENRRLQMAVSDAAHDSNGIVGISAVMQEIFATIRKIAPSDIPVLIIGESGTGKELVARAVHALGTRKNAEFIAINCGAIPENLLESELFGMEKGAFTGACAQIPGKVEYAHQGTLFLDEIGEMPLSLQVKLLRFLQEKTIQRIGGRKDIVVDARIVAATNTDITKAITEGKFREDLYYRLGVITINVPPLRERGDDILLLANLFLKRFGERNGKKVKRFNNTASEFMAAYEWPGNVREMENRIQRAVIMSESPIIELKDLGFTGAAQSKSRAKLSLKETKDLLEKEMLISAKKEFKSSITKVSEALGVSRTTLYFLMKKHNIDFDKKTEEP